MRLPTNGTIIRSAVNGTIGVISVEGKDARIRLDAEELKILIEGLRKIIRKPKEFGPYTKAELLLNRLCRYKEHKLTGRTATVGLVYAKMRSNKEV